LASECDVKAIYQNSEKTGNKKLRLAFFSTALILKK